MSKFLGYEACPRCQESGRDSKGDNMGVYADGSKHCFACHLHTFPKHYLKEVNEAIRTEDKAKLPNDFSTDVPARAWKWLLQYGLPVSYWKAHCGYSEKDQRLIIKVGEPLDFSLGRCMAVSDEPRWKWLAYGDCHRRSHLYGDVGFAKAIICVEDVISAHKVSQAGHLSLPLFGTNVYDCHIRTMLHLKLPVIMWLDKDQEHQARKRGARLSSITGLPVTYRTTEEDPKCLSISKIKSILDI